MGRAHFQNEAPSDCHVSSTGRGSPTQRGPSKVASSSREGSLQIQTKVARGGFWNSISAPGSTKTICGQEAAHHEWPWRVALFIDDAWFCGGSLISDEWVMTAAHCADGASYFDIMAGAHN